jgi:hypothetical protein
MLVSNNKGLGLSSLGLTNRLSHQMSMVGLTQSQIIIINLTKGSIKMVNLNKLYSFNMVI